MFVLAFGVMYIVWGTTFYAIKLGVQREQMPPLSFGGSRICIGGLLLFLIQWLRGEPLRMPGRDVLRLFGISVLLFVAGNGFIGYGQRTVESSLAAVQIAT